MSMIEAIIFDWGGVLIDQPTKALMKYCAKYLKVSEGKFERAYDIFKFDFIKGTISEELFWEKICSELKVQQPAASSLWGDAFKYAYHEKREVFSMASSLHNKSYKIGLLSNTEVPSVKFFYEQKYDMFDALVFSCKEGTRKPEKRIYEIALKKLQVEPKEAVFIDDDKRYTRGAEELGINTILFKNTKQLKKDLALLGVK